ncbi:MAG TPA: hypothetical protein VNH19_14960, partial [Candidatus Limnocylindrales bacterium]|nr:hypothetical protein [Candidatus Limnocylindrales bacterium]
SGIPLGSCQAGQFWMVNGDPRIIGQMAHNGAKDPNLYFATTNSDGSPIFTPPAKGTFNLHNGVRGLIYRPGLENWNIGLYKKFSINERTGFQFRAEAFDAFNHPNWGSPGLNPTATTTFGKVTGKTDDVRNLQLSLRYYF